MATPTGSTGYNLSAGGPILHPRLQGMVIQAVNSPSLTTRPIVIPDGAVLTITCNEEKASTLLLDGRVTLATQPSDRIEVRKSPHKTHFVRLGGRTFVKALREKLGWSGHRRVGEGD